jgi:hypothetical protein
LVYSGADGFVRVKPDFAIFVARDCREFRAGMGMIGAKEPIHAASQRASYP